MRTAEYGDVRVLLVDPDGPSISSAQDALDLVGEAFGRDAQMIVVPVSGSPQSSSACAPGCSAR